MKPQAFDCVKLVAVRDGSAIVHSAFGTRPVRVGDIVLFAPNVLCGSEPEDHVTVTTVYLDSDYVVDQVYWQYASVLADRLTAQQFVAAVYTEPAQVIRLDENGMGMLTPWLDELVALSTDGDFARNFYRMQALWFNIAHVVAPYIRASPVRISASQRAHIRPTLPRSRRFEPVRAEARSAAELLHRAPAERWTLDALAKRVHLSPSQLSRVFTDAYGKTPLAYLTMLRAEYLARSLRETDLPIEAAMREVGWRSRGHAAQQFRKYVGLTPTRYRQLALRAR
ncbi:helix-turn-helix domain-containing protein [Brevibacterium oceani]|uniref:helix-turn-helix domain-containing protein n=1 Tax=Brevibacterium oceani TaxID=358099 RepID=UPI0015E6BB4E|nr:AraC family transcriptional regulator [Brevibacterium oceani]